MKNIFHFLLLLFFILSLQPSAFCFSFSAYEATEQQAEDQQKSLQDIPLTKSCSTELKTKKIALVIAEEQQVGPYLINQTRYSRFFHEINGKLHGLGLQTFTPDQINRQIANAELQALLNNDSAAAQSASRRLGADFFIQGIISSRTTINQAIGIPEVHATLRLILTDASGQLLSTHALSAESYSGSDVLGTLERLINESGSRVVRLLYNDYCTKVTTRQSTVAKGTQKHPIQTPKIVTSSATKQKTSSLGQSDKKDIDVPNPVQTLVVSAEGIADPNAETYKKDKGLMIDALRADARRQAIEKVVGTYVDSSTLVENFVLINDKILTQSKGLIKKIIKETSPWLGKDGLMHIMIKAEVYLTNVQDALQTMSHNERVSLIRESGNPTISVAIRVKDSARNSSLSSQQSTIGENILKEAFKAFGYRVWSEEYSKRLQGESAKKQNRNRADFSVIGEVKFATKKIFLKASGNSIIQHILTSWTVKCLNNHTGEEIYFNNKIPRKKSWESEDAALADIGAMIGQEFSAAFFKEHLMQPATTYQLELTANKPIDYSTALLLKKEFVGLRPILNVELRDFSETGSTLYEVQFAGQAQNFNQILNNSILDPLNAKMGSGAFRLTEHHGNVVKIAVKFTEDTTTLNNHLETRPPASLADAAPERIKNLINNDQILKTIESINPYMQNHEATQQGDNSKAEGMIQDF